MKWNVWFLSMLSLWLIACNKDDSSDVINVQPVLSYFVDTRDGTSYKIVEIGNQIWFAENFSLVTDSSVIYENNIQNEKIYGRLYNWFEAQKYAPDGWHLPSLEDWMDLIDYVGDEGGRKLMDTDSDLWTDPLVKGTNSTLFSAIPAGYLDSRDSSFIGIGVYADFWASTVLDSLKAWKVVLSGDEISLNVRNFESCISVRYIKD